MGNKGREGKIGEAKRRERKETLRLYIVVGVYINTVNKDD